MVDDMCVIVCVCFFERCVYVSCLRFFFLLIQPAWIGWDAELMPSNTASHPNPSCLHLDHSSDLAVNVKNDTNLINWKQYAVFLHQYCVFYFSKHPSDLNKAYWFYTFDFPEKNTVKIEFNTSCPMSFETSAASWINACQGLSFVLSWESDMVPNIHRVVTTCNRIGHGNTMKTLPLRRLGKWDLPIKRRHSSDQCNVLYC